MPLIGFYSGSFDPPTNGHLDVIERAAAFCDILALGIGAHPTKAQLFTPLERGALIADALASLTARRGLKLETHVFSGLAVDAARKAGAKIILRGLRDGADFDYEMHMAGMNGQMAPDIATIFLPASPGVRHITATLVRQIATLGGDVSAFAPANVVAALKAKLAGRPGGV